MPTWTTTRKKFHDCNDSQVIFPFTFPIGSEADIVVKVRTDATGAVITLARPADYTVSNAGGNWDSGGSVTTVATYAVGKTLLIKRVTPKTQTKDYIEGDDFPAESHEEGIDKLTRIVQELQEEVTRSVKMPDTDDESLNMDMPSSVDRAGRWLGFDADGEPTIVNLIRIYAILDFMVTFIESADKEAACDAIGAFDLVNDVLNTISDINITDIADLELLQYDNATSKWINQTLTEIFGAKEDANEWRHDKYTDANARGAINDVIGSDGKLDSDLDADSHKITSVTDPAADQDAETKKHVADTYAPLVNNCKIQTLTYTGNGSTSYHIDTTIHPIYVKIWQRQTVDTADVFAYETTPEIMDDNVAGGAIVTYGGVVDFYSSRIISLDVDGFTVDDGGGDFPPNKNGEVYNVLVLGY